ncbi:MAG: T9SS type A sorting domain-containing protein [Calditrichaeota bacterium]|jgi:hypothetical protein|nr:T9SS type A sorting domain-containing protein [Calditrichota bacterium]MBT7615675.1 T9SS type A sorting domain-containing protein [Calditrichota bacterium]MBT7789604.1 T9SS type A sorting domain-containing protein [Calditrichota bacterium]
MKIITLTALLITLVVFIPAHAFNLRIETENPIEGEPLTLSVSGTKGSNGWHITDEEFYIEKDTIHFNFSFYSHLLCLQVITQYDVRHNYADLKPNNYTILVSIHHFRQNLDGEWDDSGITTMQDHCTVAPAPETFEFVDIYPNPFNDAANISFKVNYAGEVDISVFDISGRNLLSQIVNPPITGQFTYNLNTSDLGISSGMYFVRLQQSGNYKTRRIVLIK